MVYKENEKGSQLSTSKNITRHVKKPAKVGHHEFEVTSTHRVVIFLPVEKTDGSNALGFTYSSNKYYECPQSARQCSRLCKTAVNKINRVPSFIELAY